MKDFKNKVAVVTGAASGIGFGIAQQCLAEGMKVVLADVEEDALAKAAEALGSPDTLTVQTDVRKAEEVQALADKSMEAFGGVHLLANNAGIGAGSTVWESTLDDWEWVLGVNLWGVIHGVRAFVPLMAAQSEESHIVNTASVCGLVSSPGTGPYNVSKHAVVALTETLALDLEQKHPKVGASVLCPGHVATRVIEGFRNRPAELGDAAPPPSHLEPEMLENFATAVMDGMAPREVAGIVFNAIRDKQLYILTHPEWGLLVEERARDIARNRRPDVRTIMRAMRFV